jgi:RNA polymerase sigma-70 factor (ECF subfamily)
VRQLTNRVLAQVDQCQARLIEVSFFSGLSVEETAEVLKISAQSAMRDWKMARAWLMADLAK